jgi:hypothetical protein
MTDDQEIRREVNFIRGFILKRGKQFCHGNWFYFIRLEDMEHSGDNLRDNHVARYVLPNKSTPASCL